ncbi:MAG TPA: hypothetical protein VN923_17500, partial [Thermoanaerobaculia bacterium]|nr:hypothetical protein [Thermoanaerobaculia bacterium]
MIAGHEPDDATLRAAFAELDRDERAAAPPFARMVERPAMVAETRRRFAPLLPRLAAAVAVVI